MQLILKNYLPNLKDLALLEINSPEDKQELIKPSGLEVKWIVNPEPLNGCSDLINALSEVEWKGNNPYAWIAGEFELMRFARQLIKHEKSLPKDSMYLSCYWKIGADDPGMKKANGCLNIIRLIKKYIQILILQIN